MDEKLLSAIDRIVLLGRQNPEFDAELRRRLGLPVTGLSIGDNRLSHIYEYCIEEVVKRQALEFYKDFPITSIRDTLIVDFCRMESFRRKDNFGDFCLSLYQQIECITNTLCADEYLNTIADKMWGYPAYVKTEKGVEPTIENRLGDYSIAFLVFPSKSHDKAIEKSQKLLKEQYAEDKMRAVMYFVGYGALMESADYGIYREVTSLLSDIYQCRNTNHRGGELKGWQKEVLERVIPQRSTYYFKFLGALVQFVGQIKKGLLERMPTLKQYAKDIPKLKPKPKIELKFVGKIDLKDDGRNRFRK